MTSRYLDFRLALGIPLALMAALLLIDPAPLDFALANLAAVDTPTALKSHFGRLQLSQLAEIVRHGQRPDAPQTSSSPPPNIGLSPAPLNPLCRCRCTGILARRAPLAGSG